MPKLRIVRPMAAPTASTVSGSKLAPQDSGAGNTVACHVLRPVAFPSWTRAGMPNGPAATVALRGKADPSPGRGRAERSRRTVRGRGGSTSTS